MSDKHIDSISVVVAALQRSVADLELRLREVVRERDEAYEDRRKARQKRDLARSAWVGAESELVSTAQQLELEREASAQLRAEVGERMRETAQAQREACARHMVLSQDYSAQACRLAPLVTETEGDQ